MPQLYNTEDSTGSQENAGSEPQSGHSLHGFGIFGRALNSVKKTKADGQPPKRRGPKPDAKPALTRRQELNRQAQRTHRERKELYIKALEQEVLRLKETYGTVCRDRDAFIEENKKLRDLLAQHGINCPADLNRRITDSLSPGPTPSSDSFSGSYAPASSNSDPQFQAHYGQRSPNGHGNGTIGLPNENGVSMQYQAASQYNINVDQVGINFVLALERPCMDHSQMLSVKSLESDEDISGHILMLSCPPSNHLLEHPHIQYEHQVPPEYPAGDLMKLLDLSTRLPLDGEITPVMAWAIILRDDRFRYLNENDVLVIQNELMGKVHCYGFGAVLEEFEVKDALEGVLASKLERSNILK